MKLLNKLSTEATMRIRQCRTLIHLYVDIDSFFAQMFSNSSRTCTAIDLCDYYHKPTVWNTIWMLSHTCYTAITLPPYEPFCDITSQYAVRTPSDKPHIGTAFHPCESSCVFAS